MGCLTKKMSEMFENRVRCKTIEFSTKGCLEYLKKLYCMLLNTAVYVKCWILFLNEKIGCQKIMFKNAAA